MSWIEKIRNKPTEERIRIIWVCVIITAILLIILSIVAWKYKKAIPKDTTLFDTVSTTFHDLKTSLSSHK